MSTPAEKIKENISTVIVVVLVITGAVYLYWSKNVVESPISRTMNLENTRIIEDENSGISIRVPNSAIIYGDYNNPTKISFERDYYNSLGYSTTTSKYLADTRRDTIIMGVSPLTDSKCSLQNYSPKGSSTSTLAVDLVGESFYEVHVIDNGMNQYIDNTSYIQLLPDDSSCRYISFNKHAANPGVYNEEYWDVKNLVYQEIHAELESNKSRFYSIEDMLSSVSVRQIQEPTAIKIEGWKEYRNKKYGFSFKHPTYYILKSDGSRESINKGSPFEHIVSIVTFSWKEKMERGPYYSVDVYNTTDTGVWIEDMKKLEDMPEESVGKYLGMVVINSSPLTYKFTFDGGYLYYGIIGDKYAIYFPAGVYEDVTTRTLAKSILDSFSWIE